MPASRKRIGFLPTEEVQNIIDKISLKNNLSQSKVTGILVEEALKARNLINYNSLEELKEINLGNYFYESKNNNEGEFIAKKKEITDEKEYKLIKEYINYKNFKKMLSIVQSES